MNSNGNPFAMLLVALSIAEKETPHEDALKLFGKTYECDVDTAYRIHELSKAIGMYKLPAIYSYGDSPGHKLSTRVKNSLEFLQSRNEAELTPDEYKSLANAYRADLGSSLGRAIYPINTAIEKEYLPAALEIIYATEKILSLTCGFENILKEDLKKVLSKKTPTNKERDLMIYLIKKPSEAEVIF